MKVKDHNQSDDGDDPLCFCLAYHPTMSNNFVGFDVC